MREKFSEVKVTVHVRSYLKIDNSLNTILKMFDNSTSLSSSAVFRYRTIRSCNFESKKICGYTQDKKDAFDWTWHKGKTGSTSTGPPNDHTYGTSKGHYMYIEASSPRVASDKARLVSPTYVDKSAVCVQFYYHMLGDGMGTLNVYTKVGTCTLSESCICFTSAVNSDFLGDLRWRTCSLV